MIFIATEIFKFALRLHCIIGTKKTKGARDMRSGTVFERYEMKYLITEEQKELIKDEMKNYMRPDEYGRSTVRNIYYDTPDCLLVRRSNEKPVYKEKLRVRSYRQVTGDDENVFVELKKKYKSVVYKRRTALSAACARSWLDRGEKPKSETQICAEIEYFRNFYGSLFPTVFLSYDREAFFSVDRDDFRVTFDENIFARTTDLSLKEPVGGQRILPDGLVLAEIKTAFGMPLWMSELLAKNRIYRVPFSKYGIAYKNMIASRKGEIKDACGYFQRAV